MAFSYVPDDEAVPIIDFGEEENSHAPLDELGDIRDQAIRAQRLAVSRSVRKYAEGSVKSAASITGKLTGEKMFSISKLLEWTSGEPSELVDQMRSGRLRCRFSGAMGLGKSTFMPAYVAREMNFRVLYVTLDVVFLQQSIDYVHSRRFGKYSRRWSGKVATHLVGMTYADFVGYLASARRSEIFSSFECIIFDEAFMDNADVFVAKRGFAAYAHQDTHLILCSATIKKSDGGEDGASAGLGNFRQISSDITVSDAIASGKLLSDYLADQTAVFLPSDDAVREMYDYYHEHGVEAYFLDSASSRDDFSKVYDAMNGDSSTVRVLLSHFCHGIAMNMPVSQALIFPFETYDTVEGDSVVKRSQPMTEEFVTQCKSRSGRGIVSGSGGAVFGESRRIAGDLNEVYKMEAFVKLFSIGIVPQKTGVWAKQYETFPKGLDPTLASNLVKICLPYEVSIRYFSTDGRVASKFTRAMNVFCQPNTYLQPSDNENPPGFEKWFVEPLITNEEASVAVPMHATGELQVVLQSITCIALNLIDVPRWRPTVTLDLEDGYSSSEERRARRVKRVPALRMVEDAPPPVMKALPAVPDAWTYTGTTHARSRSGGFLESSRFRDAIGALTSNVSDFRVLDLDMQRLAVESSVPESPEDLVHIQFGDGVVESPGGSSICVLPRGIAEKFNVGKVLSPIEMCTVITAVRTQVHKFAASKLFDNFAKPWDCFLDTMGDDKVLKLLRESGLINDAYAMIDSLRRRFSVEVANVLAHSNVFKTTFLGIFSKMPSFDKVMTAINHGRFDKIAQTQGFMNRVKYLKETMDNLLLQAESGGVYLPTYITDAQRALPMRGKNVLGYVNDGLTPMPSSWRKQLEEPSPGVVLNYPLGKKS